MKNKETEAPVKMRLYSPLVGAFYDSEDHCTSMDGYALSGYDWTIKKALEKDWIQESRAGLSEVELRPDISSCWNREMLPEIVPRLCWKYGVGQGMDMS